MYDLIVIGGGASGIIAAIRAASKGKKVLIIEKKDRILKKILVTGNGQCNFTNINATKFNYHSVENEELAQEIIGNIFEKYNPEYIIDFFEKIGVYNKEKSRGKIYPYSLQANSLNDMLRYKLENLNVDIKLESEVLSLTKENTTFKIEYFNDNEKKYVFSEKVLISTGGITSFDSEFSNSIYFIINDTKHTRTKLYPTLVQLKTDKEYVKGLEGIKVDADVKFYSNSKFLRKDFGELLFTPYGISGPTIFNLSYLTAFYKFSDIDIFIDFVPDLDEKKLRKILNERIYNLNYLTLENYLTGFLPKKLGQFLLKKIGYDKLNLSVDNIINDIDKLIKILKNYHIKIEDTTGFKNAQVTAGGINISEINKKTLESKYIKNLYFAGEVLDIFGECGGYNLQYCFGAAMLIGDNI